MLRCFHSDHGPREAPGADNSGFGLDDLPPPHVDGVHIGAVGMTRPYARASYPIAFRLRLVVSEPDRKLGEGVFRGHAIRADTNAVSISSAKGVPSPANAGRERTARRNPKVRPARPAS